MIDREFERARPRILGALLDAVCAGLRKMESGVELADLPRMADFAEWAVACEEGLGLEPGAFLAAYDTNILRANGLAIEASPFAQALVAFVEDCKDWTGQPGGLLKALDGRLEVNGENPKKKNGWPQSARALGAKLKELAPNLRRSGIEITFGDRTAKGYTLMLAKARPQESQPSVKENDVHNVHNVHPPNRLNGLADEHHDVHCASDVQAPQFARR